MGKLVTFSASPAWRSTWFGPVGILGSVLMSMGAMSFSQLVSGRGLITGLPSFTPEKIFSSSYWFKMCWVNAISVAAEMINIKMFGNWAKDQLVGISMRRNLFVHSNGHRPISSVFVDMTEPEPAPGVVIFAKSASEVSLQSFWCSLVISHSVLPRSFWSGLHIASTVLRPVSYSTRMGVA